jgi:hypothetical protein
MECGGGSGGAHAGKAVVALLTRFASIIGAAECAVIIGVRLILARLILAAFISP